MIYLLIIATFGFIVYGKPLTSLFIYNQLHTSHYYLPFGKLNKANYKRAH